MATDAVLANRIALRDLETADNRLAAAISSLEATRLKLNAEEQERGKLAASVTELEGIRLKLSDESSALAEQLKIARADQTETARKLATARSDIKIAQAQLDATQTALNAAERKVDVTAKELSTARTQAADAADLLKKKEKDLDTLAKKEATSATTIDGLQRLVRTKDDERLALEARMNATRKELTALEARMRITQKDLDAQLAAARAAAKAAADELASAKADSAKTGEELATARAQVKDLTKKVDDANVTIIDLQGTHAKLADKFNKVQKETESRFAGIAMTGKKVVFLVDMSGSMGKRDINTLDGTKWPLVVETVCKVMRSIPTLEQYQVVTFSSSANWLFDAGEWQTFAGERSVERVQGALLQVKPMHDTNMHAALEKAFSLRGSGLDTIYLFSDGLPTSGPNLSSAQQALPEQERGVILARQLRETLDRSWNRAEVGRQRVRINAVGFYFESVDVGAFLWALARDNDGSFVGMSRP
jgi:archaellum component FlaC